MAILIDTSVLVELERGRTSLASLRRETDDEDLAVATITVSEILTGALRSERPRLRDTRIQFMEAVLADVVALPLSLEVARVHAGLQAERLRLGQPIGAHDLIIAATAVAHDLTLVSHDVRHFPTITGLRLVVPTRRLDQ